MTSGRGNEVGLFWSAHIDKAIVEHRLCPWWATNSVSLLIFIAEQNLVGINAVASTVMLRNIRDTSSNQLCENMSCTKPKVRNKSQHRQRRTHAQEI